MLSNQHANNINYYKSVFCNYMLREIVNFSYICCKDYLQIKRITSMAKQDGTLLIVDDDKDVLESLNMFLKHEFGTVLTTSNPNRIAELVKKERIDVVLLDMNFQAGVQTGNEGFFWMNEINRIDPNAVIVLITAYGDIELAVRTIKEGAFDFVMKPWDNDKILSTLTAAFHFSKTRTELRDLKEKQQQIFEDIDRRYKILWGVSGVMHDIFEMVKKVAPTEANILILGENGTGKELIAREIHRMSLRSREVFIHVDLGAISENLFESELFGHVKGAFTDAREDRAGRFEIAKGGSLFLDEIGNLPVYLQSKLLSTLQNREIIRLGSNELRELDVRLISATNRNLTRMVSDNLFRQDLLYRIETIRIEIPPLRKRIEDIPQLTNHFLQMYGTKYGKPGIRINEPALHKLTRHSWPGNVRELKHAIEKAVILCDTGTITPDEFMFTPVNGRLIQKQSLKLNDLERETIQEALRKTKMNLSEAARELGISRPTLYKKINKYDIQI